jgi:glycine cleavage system protein P-like pyridoxal-binding family
MTTQPSPVSVTEHIAQVMPDRRREDALRLDAIFREVSGFEPKMWGPTIIGYGAYHYVYDSGREGDMCATGFAARKANLVLYIMPGYQDYGEILARLGKHKLGKSCLYINKLADVDEDVLREVIRTGLTDLGAKWPVSAT